MNAKKSKAPQSKARPVKLLSGGNPQVTKGGGDAPLQAYIAAMPGWKNDIGKRLDTLIERCIPNVRKAVRWNSPFYGTDELGWLVSFHVLTRYVQVNFFSGASLHPIPPGSGKDPKARWINIFENDSLDEAQMTDWLNQASKIPGWESFSA